MFPTVSGELAHQGQSPPSDFTRQNDAQKPHFAIQNFLYLPSSRKPKKLHHIFSDFRVNGAYRVLKFNGVVVSDVVVSDVVVLGAVVLGAVVLNIGDAPCL
ncbi:hypothetical protein CCP2SC5_290030 [Azospirillaceae bacterium]